MGTNFYKIYVGNNGYRWYYDYIVRIIIFESKLINIIIGYNCINTYKYNPLSKINNHKECKL